MSYPSQENEFDKTATTMKNPNPLKKNWRGVGNKQAVRAEKVTIRDTNTGKTYGTRTIMQKPTTEHTTFIGFLVSEGAADITEMPGAILQELRKYIREGAKDLKQRWKHTLELVNTAYKNGNIRLPLPDQKGAWRQYEEMITYGVQQLHKFRGLNGGWRITQSSLREATIPSTLPDEDIGDIGHNRIFATIPGVGTTELHVKTLDDALDQLTNHFRHKGGKLRVDARSAKEMDLSVLVKINDEWVKRDTIKITNFS